MYQNLVRNEYGEPMYLENVLDPQEQEETYWEEMQHRADDPWYAEQCEKEHWYYKACAIFEAEGIDVPEQVKQILAEELRKKRAKEEEDAALAEAMPTVALFNKFFPNLLYARYCPPTPAEIGYVEVNFNDWSHRPYRDEVENIFKLAIEQGINAEGYISLREFKERKI